MSEIFQKLNFLLFPVDTGRKLNVRKTFRRHSRRLLNVLCRFNLRPVSTGLSNSDLIEATDSHSQIQYSLESHINK